jgi:SAM-dependent methyltransferase
LRSRGTRVDGPKGAPEPTGAAAPFFDAIAGRYDRVYALPPALSRPRMTRLLGELPPAPAPLLDLGVGTGRELPALLDAGYVVTGVDASPAMLARCARRARPIALVEADFWQPLPFESGSFEVVVALHGTLAHPPDDGSIARLASELHRVVRPGGVFVAEVPSLAWLDQVESLPAMGDRVVRRTGARTCVFEDRVADASIEARVLSDEEWGIAFSPAWTYRVEPLGDLERLVVGRRAR